MPDSPTTCPACNTRHVFSGCLRALADRLAAVEARLLVIEQRVRDLDNNAVNALVPPPSKGKPTDPAMSGAASHGVRSDTGSRPPAGTEQAQPPDIAVSGSPPPSAEPTRPTFEHLVEKAGPVSPALPLVTPGVQHSTNVRIDLEPASVASGASVPDGFALGEGWLLIRPDEKRSLCWHMDDEKVAESMCNAAADIASTRHMGRRCFTHAVKAGALVPVEPPKAETAQAAEPPVKQASPDTIAAMMQMTARWPAKQPAEPSAPVGFRVVADPMMGSATNPIVIAEPAAPPVAAKLSERWEPGSVAEEVSRIVLAFNSDDSRRDDVRRLADKVAALETALDAAKAVNEALRRQFEMTTAVLRSMSVDVGRLTAESERLRTAADRHASQLATRDARITGLEASHREDVERAVREERARCVAHAKGWLGGAWAGLQARIANGDPVPKVGG